MSALHFLSDLHLETRDPTPTRHLTQWLNKVPSGDSIYFLGDVFHHWLGDDVLDANTDPNYGIATECVELFARAVQRGILLYLQRGNRDFLVGKRFAERSGVKLIDDPHPLQKSPIGPTVLTHGDTLCEADIAYQQFRQYVRNPEWQQLFLSKPLAERHAMQTQLQQLTQKEKREKTAVEMDVTDDSVIALIQKYPCTTLIHGHTHRPNKHHVEINGHAVTRWVLPAWEGARWGVLSTVKRCLRPIGSAWPETLVLAI